MPPGVNNVFTPTRLPHLGHELDKKPISEVHHTYHRLSERWVMHCARQWVLWGCR